MSNLSVVAMKEATDLSWSQLRVQRQYLKQAGLSIPNEHEQRKVVTGLAADDIVTHMEDFFDSAGGRNRTAFGRVAISSSHGKNQRHI